MNRYCPWPCGLLALLPVFLGAIGCGPAIYREEEAQRVLRKVPQVATVERFLAAVGRTDVDAARRLAPAIPFAEPTLKDVWDPPARQLMTVVDVGGIDWRAAWKLHVEGRLCAGASEVRVPLLATDVRCRMLDGLWVRNGLVELYGGPDAGNAAERAFRGQFRLYLLRKELLKEGESDELHFGRLYNTYCP